MVKIVFLVSTEVCSMMINDFQPITACVLPRLFDNEPLAHDLYAALLSGYLSIFFCNPLIKEGMRKKTSHDVTFLVIFIRLTCLRGFQDKIANSSRSLWLLIDRRDWKQRQLVKYRSLSGKPRVMLEFKANRTRTIGSFQFTNLSTALGLLLCFVVLLSGRLSVL